MEFQTSSRFMSFLSLLSHLYCGRPPSDKSILRRGDMEPQEYDEVRRTYRVGYTYFYRFNEAVENLPHVFGWAGGPG